MEMPDLPEQELPQESAISIELQLPSFIGEVGRQRSATPVPCLGVVVYVNASVVLIPCVWGRRLNAVCCIHTTTFTKTLMQFQKLHLSVNNWWICAQQVAPVLDSRNFK